MTYRGEWTPAMWRVAGLRPWEMDDLYASELALVKAAIQRGDA